MTVQSWKEGKGASDTYEVTNKDNWHKGWSLHTWLQRKRNVARRTREVSVKSSDVEGLDCQGLREGLMNSKSAQRVMETTVREVNSRINKRNKRSFTLSLITCLLGGWREPLSSHWLRTIMNQQEYVGLTSICEIQIAVWGSGMWSSKTNIYQ